jgi:hypothetical protein
MLLGQEYARPAVGQSGDGGEGGSRRAGRQSHAQLVHQEDSRVPGHGPGQGEQLLLAA